MSSASAASSKNKHKQKVRLNYDGLFVFSNERTYTVPASGYCRAPCGALRLWRISVASLLKKSSMPDGIFYVVYPAFLILQARHNGPSHCAACWGDPKPPAKKSLRLFRPSLHFRVGYTVRFAYGKDKNTHHRKRIVASNPVQKSS